MPYFKCQLISSEIIIYITALGEKIWKDRISSRYLITVDKIRDQQ